MTFLPWSKDYSVHIRAVDNDHKELFDGVNQLHLAIEQGGAEEEVSLAMTLLARYVKEHFEREEQLMADYGYPWLAEHKAEHQRLRQMVEAVRGVHKSAPDRIDPDKLLAFLRTWLTKHILGTDMRYARYLLGEGSVGAVQSARPAEPGVETLANDEQEAVMKTITVDVPADQAVLIERLAYLLCKGGPDAATIQGFAHSIGGPTFEEALALAAPVLR